LSFKKSTQSKERKNEKADCSGRAVVREHGGVRRGSGAPRREDRLPMLPALSPQSVSKDGE
jgi:hypothetical protein